MREGRCARESQHEPLLRPVRRRRRRRRRRRGRCPVGLLRHCVGPVGSGPCCRDRAVRFLSKSSGSIPVEIERIGPRAGAERRLWRGGRQSFAGRDGRQLGRPGWEVEVGIRLARDERYAAVPAHGSEGSTGAGRFPGMADLFKLISLNKYYTMGGKDRGAFLAWQTYARAPSVRRGCEKDSGPAQISS